MTIEHNPGLQPLAEASARIGADPALVQAAGGNTSVKHGDVMWVKASGLWLRDALSRPSFVPLRLREVRDAVARGAGDAVASAVVAELAPEGLRPSIETALHALMPHAVVLHVHAVDAIAWAVRPQPQAALAQRLAGERWAWVPYARPGLPLTQAVAALTAQQPVDVLLLANHGLLVGAASVAQAQAVLARVVDKLREPLRAAPPADLAALRAASAGTRWRLPGTARVHAIATDPLNLARAQRGVLYPDHVVFLGATLATAPAHAEDGPALRAWLAAQSAAEPVPPCVALPGRGLLVHDDLGEAPLEMLACLADVLQRLPQTPEPLYLPADETQALAHWEAERFRRQFAR